MDFWYFLSENFNQLTIIISSLIGIATIITAYYNASLVKDQLRINKEQAERQNDHDQPLFIINSYFSEDSDDGKVGTERLEIRNFGAIPLAPINVKIEVVFELVRSQNARHDSYMVIINDYFKKSTIYTPNDNNIVFIALGPNSHRYYCEIYNDSVRDHNTDFTYWYLKKHILVTISYYDIHNEFQICYFNDSKQIYENQYFDIVDHISHVDYYSLKDVSFELLKKDFDLKVKNQLED